MIETITAVPAVVARRPRPGSLAAIALFTVGGAACGVAARVWMRLITTDPEFTWSGTLFIIGLFTVVGLAQGCALAVRRRGWRPWVQAPVRLLAAIAALLLGAGAGSVMLVTLVCAPPAIARSTWNRVVRVVLAVLAAANAVVMLPLLLTDLSWSRGIVGWVVMLLLYGVIVTGIAVNLRPLGQNGGDAVPSGARRPRRAPVLVRRGLRV